MSSGAEPTRLPLKVQFGFAYVYGVLAVVLAVVSFAAGVEGPWKATTKPVTVTRTVAPKDGAAVAALWGKPDTQVAGSSVNANLAGTTCDIWQSRKAVLCFQP